MKFAVLGGGSWATALVKMLTENLDSVCWYMRNEQAIAHIRKERHNPNYLSAVELRTSSIRLTSDINQAVRENDFLIFVIPSAFLDSSLSSLDVSLANKVIFSAIKGIVPETGLIVGEHFQKHHEVPFHNIGVITGPCHAEEVALERLSYLTLACADGEKAKILAQHLSSHFIKTKISDDIIGTEYAAVLKNIYAIAAGMANGLGYGDNFQSVLMSNAIREMKRFIDTVYKMKRNINNSAYLGDLLVTGYSSFSRNRMLGNMIGKGYSVKSALLEMKMIAEGYYATKSAFALTEERRTMDDTPIIQTVYGILYEKKNVKEAMRNLSDKLD